MASATEFNLVPSAASQAYDENGQRVRLTTANTFRCDAMLLLPKDDKHTEYEVIGHVGDTTLDEDSAVDILEQGRINLHLETFRLAEWNSGFALRHVFKFIDSDGIEQDTSMSTRFTHHNTGAIDVRQFSKMDPKEKMRTKVDFKLTDELVDTLEKKDLYLITFHYDSAKPNAVNMYTSQDFGDQQATVNNIREFFDRSQTQVEILAYGQKLDRIFKDIMDHQAAQRRNNPVQLWWTDENRKVVVGLLVSPENRPSYQLPAQVTFATWDEYAIPFVYALSQELEFNAPKKQPIHLVPTRTLELAGAADRGFLVVLDFSDVTLRVVAGDKVQVNFKPERDSREEDFHGVILEPDVHLSLNERLASVSRPRDKETKELKELPYPVPVQLSAKGLGSTAEARRLIKNVTPMLTTVRISQSDMTIKRELAAYSHWQSTKDHEPPLEIQQLLLATRPDKLAIVELKSHLPGTPSEKDQAFKTCWTDSNFNKQQTRAVDLINGAHPGPLRLIEGAAGTGKSFVSIEALLPYFIKGIVNKAGKTVPFKVLIAVSVNAPVDDIARRFSKRLAELNLKDKNGNDAYVIRMHAVETETAVMRRDAEAVRPKKRSLLFQEEDLPEGIEDMEAAQEFMHNFQRSTKREFDVNDKRLKELKLSAGWKMCQVVGIIPGFNYPNFEEEFEDFLRLYQQYKSGQKPDPEQFTLKTAELRTKVIEMASVLALTASTAALAAVHRVYEPHVIVIDEAARLMESSCWPFFAFYDPILNHPHG